MAAFQGRKCDRQGCDGTVDGASSTPPGWIRFIPVPENQATPKEEAMEFCSDYCVAEVAIQRYEAGSDKRFARPRGTYGPRKPKEE